MLQQPFISICIPAYKNEDYLLRLLDSIRIQSFQDFEVVISDDSPDDRLFSIIEPYRKHFHVHYVKNHVPLGSPANWNHSISMARGQWIKIMHDDDWFANESALEQFAVVAKDSGVDFVFSGFYEVDVITNEKKESIISGFHLKKLQSNPLYLFRTNYIGHPSTTMIRNKTRQWFDEKIKWVVDFEFYIRLLKDCRQFRAIRKPLVNIGISEEQITKAVFRNPDVEIPENLYLLHKVGMHTCSNIFVYDYFWRFIRNLGIRDEKDMRTYTTDELQIPFVLKKMIRVQRWISLSFLRIGVVSKTMMFLNWIVFNFHYLSLLSNKDKKGV
jgi:glycosyltransferase involved in cell wall biosynthesis